MVNSFPTTTSTPLKSDTPEIDITVTTTASIATQERFAAVTLDITGVKLSLAIPTFQRVFAYIQNLAISDINPMPGINASAIAVNSIGRDSAGVCKIGVNKTEEIETVTLSISTQLLRIDYLDEYFSTTLTYLSACLANDLNP